MNDSDNDGLGLSVALYAGAILVVLAALAVPTYLAIKPEVYDNPPLARADPLLNGPIVGNRVSTRVPLVRLKQEVLIDPAILATLNAKARKTRSADAGHTSHRAAPRHAGTPVAEMRPEPRRPTFFLFNLFGG